MDWSAEGPARWSEAAHALRFAEGAEGAARRGALLELVAALPADAALSVARRPAVRLPGAAFCDAALVVRARDGACCAVGEWDFSSDAAGEFVLRRSSGGSLPGSVPGSSPGSSEHTVALSERVRARLSEVVGVRGFSFFLRNGEHVANYVLSARWASEQADALALAVGSRSRPDELTLKLPPRGLVSDGDDVLEVNVVFYGKVSCGKSQLLRALLSEATGQVVPADKFNISASGGSTVTARSYYYEQMTLLSDESPRGGAGSSSASAPASPVGGASASPSPSLSPSLSLSPPVSPVGGARPPAQPVPEQQQQQPPHHPPQQQPPQQQPPQQLVRRQRKRARVVFWDTPGIGLKMNSGEISFADIKRGIDAGVDKVDLCVFAFNGDGNEELYGPFVEMVQQICAKNGYAAGSPEHCRAVRRVLLVRTHGDGFDWETTRPLQQQFEDRASWPADLRELLDSVAARSVARLAKEGWPAAGLSGADVSHVSTRAFIPDYEPGSPAFEAAMAERTYGIRALLDRIFATATAEISLIQLDKKRRQLESVSMGIKKELAFGGGGGSVLGLGVGAMAIGAYSVFESLVAMYGVSASLGVMGTTAIVGVPVVAGAAIGGLVAAAYKRKDIQRYMDLRSEREGLQSDVSKAGYDEAAAAAAAAAADADAEAVVARQSSEATSASSTNASASASE